MLRTASKITPNFQDLLKLIAIVTMLFDHMGLFFYHDNTWLRLIGRFSMPIFLFFAGYNYYRVKQSEGFKCWIINERYRKLLALGIALQSILLIYFPDITMLNVLISILIGLTMIDVIEQVKLPFVFLHFICFALVFSNSIELFDYGTIGTGFVILGYTKRDIQDKNFGLFLLTWLLALSFLAQKILSLSYTQNLMLLLESIILFLCFYYADLNREYNNRILLVSRYLLPIYFWHFVTFTIVAWYLYG